MNFRGVGQSEGSYDAGIGETDDMELLLNAMRLRFPVATGAGRIFPSVRLSRVACSCVCRNRTARQTVWY
jgi:alpha/beta superfamily hydrolase